MQLQTREIRQMVGSVTTILKEERMNVHPIINVLKPRDLFFLFRHSDLTSIFL